MKNKERILFAIPSFQDPHFPNQPQQLGSIARLLASEKFERVILIGLRLWKFNLFLTEQYIGEHWPNVKIEKTVLPIDNIAAYKEVFYGLKKALDAYTHLLHNQENQTSFLLPPSLCDKLLDCWLLLVTSLNLKAKIYQLEPHYSIQGLYSDDVWNKGLDWLNEKNTGLHDCIIPNPKALQAGQSSEEIEAKWFDQLLPLRETQQSLLLLNHHEGIEGKVARWLSKNKEDVLHRACLNVHCEELPNEICEDILFGYKRELSEQKVIQRSGLVKKLGTGIVSVANIDKLPLKTQEKFADLIEEFSAPANRAGLPISRTSGSRFVFSISNPLHLEDAAYLSQRLKSLLMPLRIHMR